MREQPPALPAGIDRRTLGAIALVAVAGIAGWGGMYTGTNEDYAVVSVAILLVGLAGGALIEWPVLRRTEPRRIARRSALGLVAPALALVVGEGALTPTTILFGLYAYWNGVGIVTPAAAVAGFTIMGLSQSPWLGMLFGVSAVLPGIGILLLRRGRGPVVA